MNDTPLRVRAGDRFVPKVWPWGSFPPAGTERWSNCWIRLPTFDVSLLAYSRTELASLRRNPFSKERFVGNPIYFADHGDCIELYPVPDRDIEIIGR